MDVDNMEMDNDMGLVSEPSDKNWPFEKITPFSTTNGCYRSRIYTSTININPLIASCDQILSLVTILQDTEYPDDYDRFLQDLTHEIRSFEHRAQIANYPTNTILEARYALCYLLDETIASTEWYQKNSIEPKKNMLSIFYNEGDNSNRFFSIINKSLKAPQQNLHLIELIYLCLNLGSINKTNINKNKQNILIATSNKLYQTIAQHNHLNLKNMFIDDSQNSLQQHETFSATPTTNNINKKIFGITITIAAIISGIFFWGIHIKLNNLSKPIYTTIEQPFKR